MWTFRLYCDSDERWREILSAKVVYMSNGERMNVIEHESGFGSLEMLGTDSTKHTDMKEKKWKISSALVKNTEFNVGY